MFSTRSTYNHNLEHNKENFDDLQYLSTNKTINDDDDNDAESSHSDCVIIEPNVSLTPSDESNDCVVEIYSMGILPDSLPKQTDLILVYENRMMDVRLVAAVVQLQDQPRVTISHSNNFYSIPKRHLYLSVPCSLEHGVIAQRSRVLYRPSTGKAFSLGLIRETPSMSNRLRHLVLFDDGTAIYTRDEDRLYLCLCQDFDLNLRSIESKYLREHFEEVFQEESMGTSSFRLHQCVRVRKFDDKFHSAQIIEIDGSIIKVKFYQRQAQTEIWIHHQSTLIDFTPLPENKRQRIDVDLTPSSSPPTPLTILPSISSDCYQVHQCSLDCVLAAEKSFNPRRITQNPHTLPLTCGWTYFHIDRCAEGRFTKKPTTRKRAPTNYLYRSPCGRSLLTLDEVQDYLIVTNSNLSIKFFLDNRATSLHSSFHYDSQYIIEKDISHGKESVSIAVYNEDRTTLPEPFIYGIDVCSQLPLLMDEINTMSCCSCLDDCRDRMKCACWLKTFQQAKLNDNEQILNWKRQNLTDEQMISRFAYSQQRLKTNVWSGIYECNSKCSCNKKHCTNRLVQNGLYQQLQLFHTERKGWGLRVLHDIPFGSFINTYIGELITEEIATHRDYKYLASLDHKSHLLMHESHKQTLSKMRQKRSENRNRLVVKNSLDSSIENSFDDDENGEAENPDDGEEDENDDEPCFILDAKDYGSISRFYNHSCKPNVNIQNVFIETHDPRFPVIALFACRNIRAGEEICWDYNYAVGCMPGVRIDCQCQSSNCRGRLL